MTTHLFPSWCNFDDSWITLTLGLQNKEKKMYHKTQFQYGSPSLYAPVQIPSMKKYHSNRFLKAQTDAKIT